jgi:uncharacterized protein DUF397
VSGLHPLDLTWRKSSRSGQADNCVEVARKLVAAAVRDSKNRGGPILEFGPREWSAFVRGLPR